MGNFPNSSDAVVDFVRLGGPVLLMVWRKRWIHRIGLAALTVNLIVQLFE